MPKSPTPTKPAPSAPPLGSFPWALAAVLRGEAVRRASWQPLTTRMIVSTVDGAENAAARTPERYLALQTADGRTTGILLCEADLTAADWTAA